MARFKESGASEFSKTERLILALDDATRRAFAEGLRADRHGEPVRNALAKHILELAKRGQDHEYLVEGALRRLLE
jgi:hypothetical protein